MPRPPGTRPARWRAPVPAGTPPPGGGGAGGGPGSGLQLAPGVSRMSRGPAPVFSGPVPGERRKPKPVNAMHLKSAGKIIRFSNKLYCGCANSSTCAQNLALLRIPAFSGPGTGPEKTGAGSRDILLTLLQSSNNLSGARPLSSLALRASLTLRPVFEAARSIHEARFANRRVIRSVDPVFRSTSN